MKMTSLNKYILNSVIFLSSILSCELFSQCVNTFPYSEGFESAPSWTVAGTNSDWAWGTPAHPTINSAGGGTKSWCVGGLTGSFYNLSEQASLTSPCFDFTTLNYPWISLKIFWEEEYRWDGMVLQSSINNGASWQNVGAFGDPVDCNTANWYTYNNITWLNSIPAAQRHGWTGRLGPTVGSCTGGNGSGGWLVAKHCLTGLANQPNVIFRFLFGSGTTCNNYDGIAIDDITISNGISHAPTFTFNCNNFTAITPPCPTVSSYTWNFGDPLSGASNISSLVNPTHIFSGPGTYSVTLSVSGGQCNPPASFTQTISVSNFAAPISSQNVSCFGGNNGSATVTASGNSPFSYTWSPSGGNFSVANGLNVGTYSVQIKDASNCVTTKTVIITQPSILNAPLVSTNILCYGNATGSAAVTASGGTGPYTYTWSPSGGNSASANNLTAGSYTVIVEDTKNCTVNSIVNITEPTVLTAILSSTNINCNGANNGIASVVASGGTPGYSYTWSPAGGNFATANVLSAGVYTITINDNNNCTLSATASITEPAPLTTTISANSITCFGAANGSAMVTVSGGNPGYAYVWSPSGGNSSTANGLSPGTYTVTITDVNNCTVTDVTSNITEPSALTATIINSNTGCNSATGSATVTASGGVPGYNYSWMPSAITTSVANGLAIGNYTVTITDAFNCSAIQSVTINQSTLIQAGTFNYTICEGMSVNVTATVSGGAAPYVFNWNGGNFAGQTINVNPVSNAVYTLVVTDNNGCISSPVTSSVTVLPQPTVSISGTDSVCVGNSATFSANISGFTGNASYLWSPGSYTTSVITVSPTANTIYTINVSAQGTCQFNDQNQIAVAVLNNPVISFSNSNIVGCAPLCVDFNDNSSTSTGTITGWAWNFTNGQSSVSENSTLCFNEPGTYKGNHTVVNSFGCSTTIENFVTIIVHPKPIADFNHAPIKPIINIDGEVVFTDASHGADIVGWNWYFTNTAEYTSILQNPTFVYAEAGTYVVTLVVKSDKGCLDTILRPLIVGEDFGIYVPNAFTPNSDGLNDVFQPKGFGIVKYELFIFDRWGEKLFHTKNFDEAWDGGKQIGNDVNYSVCEEGVYVWLINATDVFGKSHELKGHVTLIK